jgi:hypothetical protein
MIGYHNLWAVLGKLIRDSERELFDARWWRRTPVQPTARQHAAGASNGTIERRGFFAALAAGPLFMLGHRGFHRPRTRLSGKSAMFVRREHPGRRRTK